MWYHKMPSISDSLSFPETKLHKCNYLKACHDVARFDWCRMCLSSKLFTMPRAGDPFLTYTQCLHVNIVIFFLATAQGMQENTEPKADIFIGVFSMCLIKRETQCTLP